jgi:hypothetical protein
MLTHSVPYLARQLLVFGPGRALSRRVSLCYVLLTLDGDAKRIHGVYPGSGEEGPTSSGERRELYFLAPKCLCRGYKP